MTRPFRLTADYAKERAEHRTLAKWLRLFIGEPSYAGYCGTMWFTVDHGISGSDGERIDAWRRGVVSGVPDIVFIRLQATYWIELKCIGGRPTDNQRAVHDRLRGMGHLVAVAEGADAAIAQLETWGIPLRGRIAA